MVTKPIRRFLAFFLAMSLGAPPHAFALRDESVTEKKPEVLAGLETALRDPNTAIEKVFRLDSPSPAAGLEAPADKALRTSPFVAQGGGHSLVYDSKNRRVFFVAAGGVRALSLITGELTPFSIGGLDDSHGIAYNPDQDLLYVSEWGNRHRIRAFSVKTDRPEERFQISVYRPSDMVYVSKGEKLHVIIHDVPGKFLTFDANTGEPIGPPPVMHLEFPSHIAYDPDKNMLFILQSGLNRSLFILRVSLDSETGLARGTWGGAIGLPEEIEYPTGFAYGSGKLFVTGAKPPFTTGRSAYRMRTFSVRKGKPIKPEIDLDMPQGVVYLPDEDALLVSEYGRERRTRAFSAQTGKPVALAAGLEGPGRTEIPTYRRALLLGGVGNIGRGHIAPMLSRDDFDILFVDFNQSLIAAANEQDSYVVTPVGPGELITVRHFWGIDALDQERVAAQGPRADWIFTTVGTDNIIRLRDVVYKFIRNRIEADHLATLNIVFAENLPIDQPQIAALRQAVLDMSDEQMARYVQDHVNFIGAPPVEDFREYEQDYVGWPGAVVSITVPPTLAKVQTGNLLDIPVEGGGPYELVVDGKELKNTPIVPSGIKLVNNIRAAREKKLLIHNMGHAAFAYLAWVLGMEPTGNPAVAIRQDARIARIVRRAMEESVSGLLHRYPDEFTQSEMEPYIDDLLERFANVELNDTVERIARDPLRKLAKNDRLIGAAISAREAGVEPEAILLAVAAAIRYAEGQKVLGADLQAVKQQIQALGFSLPQTDSEFWAAFNRLTAAGLEEYSRMTDEHLLQVASSRLLNLGAEDPYRGVRPEVMYRRLEAYLSLVKDLLDVLKEIGHRKLLKHGFSEDYLAITVEGLTFQLSSAKPKEGEISLPDFNTLWATVTRLQKQWPVWLQSAAGLEATPPVGTLEETVGSVRVVTVPEGEGKIAGGATIPDRASSPEAIKVVRTTFSVGGTEHFTLWHPEVLDRAEFWRQSARRHNQLVDLFRKKPEGSPSGLRGEIDQIFSHRFDGRDDIRDHLKQLQGHFPQLERRPIVSAAESWLHQPRPAPEAGLVGFALDAEGIQGIWLDLVQLAGTRPQDLERNYSILSTEAKDFEKRANRFVASMGDYYADKLDKPFPQVRFSESNWPALVSGVTTVLQARGLLAAIQTAELMSLMPFVGLQGEMEDEGQVAEAPSWLSELKIEIQHPGTDTFSDRVLTVLADQPLDRPVEASYQSAAHTLTFVFPEAASPAAGLETKEEADLRQTYDRLKEVAKARDWKAMKEILIDEKYFGFAEVQLAVFAIAAAPGPERWEEELLLRLATLVISDQHVNLKHAAETNSDEYLKFLEGQPFQTHWIPPNLLSELRGTMGPALRNVLPGPVPSRLLTAAFDGDSRSRLNLAAVGARALVETAYSAGLAYNTGLMLSGTSGFFVRKIYEQDVPYNFWNGKVLQKSPSRIGPTLAQAQRVQRRRTTTLVQLLRAVSDEDPDLREAGEEELREHLFGSGVHGAVADPETLPLDPKLEDFIASQDSKIATHIRNLAEDDSDLRWVAADFLEKVGPDAAEAVPALTQVLSDPSKEVRQKASLALGAIGYAASPAVEKLRVLAQNDPDNRVKEAAKAALAIIAPAAGLEQRRAALEDVRGFLRFLAEQAPRGMTTTAIGKNLRDQYPFLNALAGLESQNIFFDDGDLPGLMAELISRNSRSVVYAGLEPEAQAFARMAPQAGIEARIVTPEQGQPFVRLVLEILSQATGLEQGAIEALQGFQAFMTGLETLSSGA